MRLDVFRVDVGVELEDEAQTPKLYLELNGLFVGRVEHRGMWTDEMENKTYVLVYARLFNRLCSLQI
jgi:hypothetical protein